MTTDINAALRRFAAAVDVADVLDCACVVFESILEVLRRHQEDEVSAFPAFVLATCAAANGRDWTGGDWAPQPDTSEQDAASRLPDATASQVAVAVAAACDELSIRLSACAAAAANEVDQACCEHAATEAAAIHSLMGGASPP